LPNTIKQSIIFKIVHKFKSCKSWLSLSPMLTANEIRSQFLDFFKSKGHQVVPSAPIVVKNDPTLLFTNAGMNQFKDYFLGNKKPEHSRVADTQKCLRVSGKHNDLEEVGVDTYHHTMFEMLGNWSFGDYFKKEAIEWSWELLTGVYKLDKGRLYVTVFEGDAKEGLPKDEEAYNCWKQHIAADRILSGNKKDNFWEMGDTGPCGPCSEIHVDCRSDEERKKVDGKTLVNADHPQVIEIWNNVFMQFNRMKDGSLQLLPAMHVDTGMGLERLVRVIQGKHSNYDTDLFEPLTYFLEKKFPANKTIEKVAIAHRVIADHIRAVSFTLADGQLPSNIGAGYVIRRILRRAIRYGYSFLNAREPFIYELVDVLDGIMGGAFPEIRQQKEFIKKVIKEEEAGFFKTLSDGVWKLGYFIQYGYHSSFPMSDAESIESHRKKVVPGKLAFNLYDTDGFPLDLTILMAKESGFEVDEQAFEAEMQQQKTRSRAATALDTDDWIVLKEGGSKFVGYDNTEAEANVLKYRKVKAKGKESYQVVIDNTPFYAESGGQIGDTGELIFGDEGIEVLDTKKENDLIIHFTEKLPTDINLSVIAIVDVVRREKITVHHSATHLLHAALRQVLGTHVAQKGSLVEEDHLRFDFSHFAKVTEEEISKIEAIVNEKIRENIPVVIKEMPKDEAVKLGAMALFGEKYGNIVRVVIIDPGYSIELCGGTHVSATGQLGFFKITSEAAVAAGVRRIEAVSGKAVEQYINDKLALIHQINEQLKHPKDIIGAINKLSIEKNKFEKKVEELDYLLVLKESNELAKNARKVEDYNIISNIILNSSESDINSFVSYLSSSLKDKYFIILSTVENNNVSFALKYSDPLASSSFINIDEIANNIIIPKVGGKKWYVGKEKNYLRMTGLSKDKLSEVMQQVTSSIEDHLEAQKGLDEFLKR